MLSQLTIEHLLVIMLSLAAWFVPLMSIQRRRRLQFRISSLLAMTTLAGLLCVAGFEFAVCFLVLGGSFGLVLSWVILAGR